MGEIHYNMLKENLSNLKDVASGDIHITDAEPVLRIAVCDDEKAHMEELGKILCNIKGKCDIHVESFLSPHNFLNSLREGEALPDIIFLDIEMQELDGITLGKEIHNLSPDSYVIFLTAHPEYAVRGYEARAFRYLLKPSSEEVIANVLLEVNQERCKKKKLLLQCDGKEHVIPLKDIMYIGAEDKYTVLYTRKHRYIERISLNEYEKLLVDYGFYRVHRKYIVNFAYHKGMEKGKVYLPDDISIPICRRREKEYHKALLQYLEKELI